MTDKSTHRQPKHRTFVQTLAANLSLQGCSLAAQGLMFRLVALMERMDPPGPLYEEDGSPMGFYEIAVALNVPASDVASLVGELKAEDVLDEDPDTGALYYQPLARTLAISVERAKAGSKGGVKAQAKRLFSTDGGVTGKGEEGQANAPGRRKQNRVPKTVASPWLLWLRAHRTAGVYREYPPSCGPDTKAAKELSASVPCEAKLEKAMVAYLLDRDDWLVGQGHPLRLLPGRLLSYFRVEGSKDYDGSDNYGGSDWRRRNSEVEVFNLTGKRTDREIAEGAIAKVEKKKGTGQ